MNYYSLAFPIFSSSDGIAFEIYLSGCNGYCENCHSKHTWDFKAGNKLIIKDLISEIKKVANYIDTIVILGGEPFDQPESELKDLLNTLDENFPNKKIYLYTHFQELTVKSNFNWALKYLDFIKVGKYLDDFKNVKSQKDKLTNVTLVTTNQYFIEGERSKIFK